MRSHPNGTDTDHGNDTQHSSSELGQVEYKCNFNGRMKFGNSANASPTNATNSSADVWPVRYQCSVDQWIPFRTDSLVISTKNCSRVASTCRTRRVSARTDDSDIGATNVGLHPMILRPAEVVFRFLRYCHRRRAHQIYELRPRLLSSWSSCRVAVVLARSIARVKTAKQILLSIRAKVTASTTDRCVPERMRICA
jgi:hypothetical protein